MSQIPDRPVVDTPHNRFTGAAHTDPKYRRSGLVARVSGGYLIIISKDYGTGARVTKVQNFAGDEASNSPIDHPARQAIYARSELG